MCARLGGDSVSRYALSEEDWIAVRLLAQEAWWRCRNERSFAKDVIKAEMLLQRACA